jgi:hypothetical protein
MLNIDVCRAGGQKITTRFVCFAKYRLRRHGLYGHKVINVLPNFPMPDGSATRLSVCDGLGEDCGSVLTVTMELNLPAENMIIQQTGSASCKRGRLFAHRLGQLHNIATDGEDRGRRNHAANTARRNLNEFQVV